MTLAARRGRRPDLGKVVMVPLALGFLLVDGASLGRGTGPAVLRWLSTGLVCLFYLLIIWCYLRRGPARATSRSVTAHAAAVTAMMVPFAFPLLGSAVAGTARQWVGNALIAAGTAWSVWSLRSLGRNVSVLAQARDLAEAGPYRWIRHPLYTGEIVSSLGLAVLAGGAAALAVWLAFIALQAYRALREEQLLVRVLPAYRSYRERTAALIPGLFLIPRRTIGLPPSRAFGAAAAAFPRARRLTEDVSLDEARRGAPGRSRAFPFHQATDARYPGSGSRHKLIGGVWHDEASGGLCA